MNHDKNILALQENKTSVSTGQEKTASGRCVYEVQREGTGNPP